MIEEGTTGAVQVSVEGGVAVVRLHRPEVHNALDPATTKALCGVIERISGDAATRAIVLIGGTEAFSTGEDLNFAAQMRKEEFVAQVEDLQHLATLLRAAPQPVIAAVAGYAVGAGLELAVNCDARIASPNATFATPEVSWGLTPTNGSSILLRRLVGDGWTRELMLLGRVVDAETAAKIGLVTSIVEIDRLESTAVEVAQRVAASSAEAVRATKQLLNAEPSPWEAILKAEVAAVTGTYDSDHTKERLARFASRKDPEQ